VGSGAPFMVTSNHFFFGVSNWKYMECDIELKNKVLVDQVSRFVSQGIIGICGTMIASCILAVMLLEVITKLSVIIWWSIIIIVSIGRLILHIHSLQQGLTTYTACRLKNILLMSLALSGCVWGAAPIFIFPYVSLSHQMILVFIVGGLIAGSVSTFASIREGFYVFCVPAITPLIVIFFIINDRVHVVMAITLMIFFIFMDIANKKINLDILDFIFIKNKNINLISELEKEIIDRKKAEEELVVKNQHIESIIDERTVELRVVNGKLLSEISERIESEKSLRESEERFKALQDAYFGGIAIHDKGLILDCNQGLSDITGYSVEELIGMDGLELIGHDWRPTVMHNMLSDFSKAYDVEGIRKNGTIFPLSLRGKNMPYKGRSVRVTEFRDMTEWKNAEEERKKLQTQLLQVQKMEAIGTMAGGIAHDFNNILAGIIGYAEIVLRNLSGEQNQENQQYVRNILIAGERARGLIQKILTFSRQTETERRPLRVQRAISEVLQLIRVSLPSTISIEHHFDSQATVLADPIQLHQVFMNLCANAGHEMKEHGGTLTITMDDVFLDTDFTNRYPEITIGKYVRIELADTGKGIHPKLLERIFEPFFTTKKIGEGTGMGLSMVHGIIRDMHGLIIVESQEGRGTRFTIYLPITDEEEVIAAVEPEPIPVGNEHVVYVDDEQFLVEIGSEILRGLGYQVTGFTHSDEALQYLVEHSPEVDVVISDMTMPKLTGLELAHNLHQFDARLPVIICTGHNEGLSQRDIASMGIHAILLKPVTVNKLAVAVRDVLDKKY